MNKEGLEALENIGFEPLYQNEDGSYWRVRDENKEDFEIIEKELKRPEELEKAREIIRRTLPDFCLLHNCDNVDQYNLALGADVGNTPLTEEEFNLLQKLYVY